MKKLIGLYFDDVFCGWADPEYTAFFRMQGYTLVRWYNWLPL